MAEGHYRHIHSIIDYVPSQAPEPGEDRPDYEGAESEFEKVFDESAKALGSSRTHVETVRRRHAGNGIELVRTLQVWAPTDEKAQQMLSKANIEAMLAAAVWLKDHGIPPGALIESDLQWLPASVT